MDLYSLWNFPGQNTGVGSLAHLQEILPTQVSPIAGKSFSTEPPEKPKNTGVGSLSLRQQIFPTQELSWGLLHCKRILYQLSYEESPMNTGSIFQKSIRAFWWEHVRCVGKTRWLICFQSGEVIGDDLREVVKARSWRLWKGFRLLLWIRWRALGGYGVT